MTTGYEADHYVPRLDLGADPFADDFESEYFYGGAMRRQVLEQLVHFCRFSDQVVVLVGATGSGTSTLLDQACSQLEPLMDCCFINAEEAKTPEQMLLDIVQQLRLPAHSAGSVHALLSELSATGLIDDEAEPVLVAVDQAQYMALETFQLLEHLADAANGQVRLLLAGEYQVEQLARLAGFQSEQIKLLELEPLGQAEVSDYLLGLLQSVGYAGEAPLDADQLAVLQEQSGGNITELNQLLPGLLMADEPLAPVSAGFGLPVVHVVSIAVLAAILLAAIFYGTEADEEEVTAVGQLAVKLPDKVSAPVLLPVNKLDSVKPVSPAEQVAAENKPMPAETEAISKAKGSKTKGEQPQLEKALALEKDYASGAIQRGVDSSADSEAVQEQSAPTRKAPPQTVAVQVASKPETAVLKKTVAKPAVKADTNVSTAVAPKPSPKPAASAQASKPVPAREQRLLSYTETDYMLQLMGSVDEQRTRDFIKQYVGRLPVTYFETRLKGKPWFVAVTGPYPDKPQALAAVKVLPATLAKLKPWARSVASIQSDIRQHHDI